MLYITIPAREFFDERTNTFFKTKEQTLQLEHSLVSLSKWESKWCKAYLTKQEKTYEEIIDYVRCMTLTQNVNPDIYRYLSKQNIKDIEEYIQAPMTATYFDDEESDKNGGRKDTVTAELIYYWMISLNIPLECQKWHLNRLMALIKVCNIKNSPNKRMSQNEVINRNRRLNAARRKRHNTRG